MSGVSSNHCFVPDVESKLYDSKDKQVVTYERKFFKTHPRRQGYLKIAPEIAEHPDKLDAVLLSFWIFKVCRDVYIPWKHKYTPKILSTSCDEPTSMVSAPSAPEGVKARDFCEVPKPGPANEQSNEPLCRCGMRMRSGSFEEKHIFEDVKVQTEGGESQSLAEGAKSASA